jgi:hypothetical protein
MLYCIDMGRALDIASDVATDTDLVMKNDWDILYTVGGLARQTLPPPAYVGGAKYLEQVFQDGKF